MGFNVGEKVKIQLPKTRIYRRYTSYKICSDGKTATIIDKTPFHESFAYTLDVAPGILFSDEELVPARSKLYTFLEDEKSEDIHEK